jgi:DNA invertase Pin-like site-specific DNA recombinase
MRAHAHHLGWPDERIEVVETDMGRTAQSTERRDGYKALLAEVALGQVGIVLSYESTRLSRNCTDWYPLLDLCAYNHCLIADRDGVYDAATPNGRLLLGMKKTSTYSTDFTSGEFNPPFPACPSLYFG